MWTESLTLQISWIQCVKGLANKYLCLRWASFTRSGWWWWWQNMTSSSSSSVMSRTRQQCLWSQISSRSTWSLWKLVFTNIKTWTGQLQLYTSQLWPIVNLSLTISSLFHAIQTFFSQNFNFKSHFFSIYLKFTSHNSDFLSQLWIYIVLNVSLFFLWGESHKSMETMFPLQRYNK